MVILLRSPSLDLPFFGVQMLLLDLEVDLKAIKAFNGLAELPWMIFFHI